MRACSNCGRGRSSHDDRGRCIDRDARWSSLVGDDGEGNCWGCGEPLDRINVECPVCLQALDVIGGNDAEA